MYETKRVPVVDFILRKYAGMGMVVFLLYLPACKTQQPCLPQTITRDSVRVQYRTDSVYLYERDSIFVQQRADTVYLTRYTTRYKDVLRLQHDTIVDTRHEVQVQQVRYVPKYYSVVSWGFWIFVVLLLLRIVLWVVKKYYGR